MSNQEQSQINPISQSTSTEQPLHDCLQSSLEFRLAHRARAESSVEEDAIERNRDITHRCVAARGRQSYLRRSAWPQTLSTQEAHMPPEVKPHQAEGDSLLSLEP